MADSSVNPDNGQWQNLVFQLVPREKSKAEDVLHDRVLPGGRYLVRMFLDREGNTERNRDYEFQPGDLYREVEINGEWKPGWREPMIIELGK